MTKSTIKIFGLTNKKPVRFLAANDGGLEMFTDPGEKLAWAATPEMVAHVLKKNGMADVVHGSSSMDFADENGFAHYGDANKLWDEALGIYNWEVNGVAS